MKRHRDGASDSKDPGTSIDIPRAKALGGDSNIPDVSKSLVFTEEWVWTFLRVASDHQAYEIEFEEHGHVAFESVIQVWRWFVIQLFHHYYSALCYFRSF